MKRASTRWSVLGLTVLVVAALGWLMIKGGWTDAQAAEKSDAKVKVKATADKPGEDGKQVITLDLSIEKGWHIHANPVENEEFAANATVVKVASGGKAREAKVAYPPGKLWALSAGGPKIRVYEDKVTIKATVDRGALEADPLKVTIRVNACDDKTCLPPGTLTVEVP